MLLIIFAFYQCTQLASVVRVPTESVATYKAAEFWSDFANFVGM